MFEGTEKKLELILERSLPGWHDRRAHRWDAAVEACGATILNRMTTPAVDAYLLSESSLFVWEHRVVMITCGQTSLVESTGPLLEQIGAENVAVVVYARQNMRDPTGQPRSFADDRRHLASFFDGQTRRFGSADGDHVDFFYAGLKPLPQVPAATLQVGMHDLDPGAESVFAVAAGDRCPSSAIDRIKAQLPGMQLDQHFFEPCGYSLNAVAGGDYSTVHVTPQQTESYASFETNRPGRDIGTLLGNLVEVFRPDRFSTLLTTHEKGGQPGLNALPAEIAHPRYHLARQTCADMGDALRITFGHYAADRPLD